MENFIAYNPTSVHFGRNVCDDLAKSLAKFGKKVLLVYGKGSIKKNGLYELIRTQLEDGDFEVVEYSGIKSNPVVEDVDSAAALGREHNVDVILAVGGGSVVDSAKIVSIGIPYGAGAWDFFEKKARPAGAVPLVTVLTLAATGTEMNMFAVLQNHATGLKAGYGHPLLYPKHSFLDPYYTISVPIDYTAYGIVDLMAHALEAYFGSGDASLSDRFVFSILSEAIEYGPQLMNKPDDYTLRARVMWAACCALNGTPMHGRQSGDWGVHAIGHSLSLLYDIAHGASLSIAYPAWMKLMLPEIDERLLKLGRNIFGINSANGTIDAISDFFGKIDAPVRLSEVGIEDDKHREIEELLVKNSVTGAHHKIKKQDYPELIKLMSGE